MKPLNKLSDEELIEKLKEKRQELHKMIQTVADELYGWEMTEDEINEFLHILDEANLRLMKEAK